MKRIIGIDPGPDTSGVAIFDPWEEKLIFSDPEMTNMNVRILAANLLSDDLVFIEYTPPYTLTMKSKSGSPHSFVPNQVMLTAIEIGRMIEAFDTFGTEPELVTRTNVKKQLLGRTTGTDANVTQAVAARFGGTTNSSKGTKKKPGPLYGIKSHAWQALAVAIVGNELHELKEGSKCHQPSMFNNR